MGTSITEATLLAWTRQVGDPVAEDETICEISTDKVDSECPSPARGVLLEILVQAGETVEVGTVLARIATSALPTSEPTSPLDPVDRPATAVSLTVDEPGKRSAARQHGLGGRYYSPIVRRIAAHHQLELETIAGSGRNGRVTKQDALAAVEQAPQDRPLHSESPYKPDPVPAATAQSSPPSRPAGLGEDRGGKPERLSRMRLAIGTAMLKSQAQAATAHTVVECDMTNVVARRHQQGLTALPIVAAATIETLREFPDLNATLADEFLTRYDRVHLGVAVSLGAAGLIVPVITDAQNLSVSGLSAKIKDVAQRARANTLAPDEVHGATFTITSPGAAGALIATPIINLPQVAILDLEAIVRRPVVVGTPESGESIAIRSIANLVLGWDHRAIDGMYAAQFLTELRRKLEVARS